MQTLPFSQWSLLPGAARSSQVAHLRMSTVKPHTGWRRNKMLLLVPSCPGRQRLSFEMLAHLPRFCLFRLTAQDSRVWLQLFRRWKPRGCVRCKSHRRSDRVGGRLPRRYLRYPADGRGAVHGQSRTLLRESRRFSGIQSEANKSTSCSLAFTAGPTGTLAKNTEGSYYNFAGTPSPSIINWFPELEIGTYTESPKQRGAWQVTPSTSSWAVSFRRSMGSRSKRLVRFAIPDLAPKKKGPKLTGSNFRALVQWQAGGIKVTWQANWDIDDLTLKYRAVRNGNTTSPLAEIAAKSTFWNRPALNFTDTTATPGATYSYRIDAADSAGNIAKGASVSISVPAAPNAARLLPADGEPEMQSREPNRLTENSPSPETETTSSISAAPTPSGSSVPADPGMPPTSVAVSGDYREPNATIARDHDGRTQLRRIDDQFGQLGHGTATAAFCFRRSADRPPRPSRTGLGMVAWCRASPGSSNGQGRPSPRASHRCVTFSQLMAGAAIGLIGCPAALPACRPAHWLRQRPRVPGPMRIGHRVTMSAQSAVV